MEQDLTPQVLRLPMAFIDRVSSPSELAARNGNTGTTQCTVMLPANNTGERKTIVTSVPTELIESLQSAYGMSSKKPEGPPNQAIREGSWSDPTNWEDLSWFTRFWWCITHYFEWSKRRAIGNAACMMWNFRMTQSSNEAEREVEREISCKLTDLANKMWDEEFQRYMKWKNK